MDWIEQLWGLNLDNGDGSVERAITIVFLCTLASVAWVAMRRRGRAGPGR
jgi:hypothetical protein